GGREGARPVLAEVGLSRDEGVHELGIVRVGWGGRGERSWQDELCRDESCGSEGGYRGPCARAQRVRSGREVGLVHEEPPVRVSYFARRTNRDDTCALNLS